ncbi:MAG: RHS repeat domain-containing protein [Aridibacter sp.]
MCNSQTIKVPTANGSSGFTAVQTYTYDTLNRIKTAVEKVGTSEKWKQTFTYDRYGNRNFDAVNTTTIAGCPANQCNPTINTANNRFNSGQGYTYDLSGNIVSDAEGRTFIYDAENKQKEVKNSSNITVGTYFYDGDGKRVKKVTASEEIVFVYDAGGKLVAEYSSLTPQTTATTRYLTSDHLGSPRIITDQNGAVLSRRDFAPFGEELYTGTGNRATGHGYTYGDSTSQKFTGYQKDEETDLDFAEARYYKSQHGRFTSADEPFADQFESNPQSWNLYVYVRNNPMNLVDPLGTKADGPGFWEKLGNWFSYGYFVGNDEIAKLEQERRDWLAQNILRKDEDGKWHQVDVSGFTTQEVFDTYKEIKFLHENGDLERVSDDLAREALNLDSVPLPASAPTNNVGPSGKVSTKKYLEKNWDKATFGNTQKSIQYHLKKHGKGLTATQYTQKALKAFKDSGAVKTTITDNLGRKAVQVVSKHGKGLYTSSGKIIWFQPK